MTKILLTAADLYSPNLGVNALSNGAILALSQHFSDDLIIYMLNCRGYSASEKVISFNGKNVLVKKIKPTDKNLYRSVIKGSVYALLPKKFKQGLAQKDDILRLYINADYVIDLAEGDSFTSIYGRRRILLHTLYKLPAFFFDKSVTIFPQTLGPFDSVLSKIFAGIVLNRVKLIFPREPHSTYLVNSIVKEKDKVIEASDMAFLMKPEKVNLPLLYKTGKYIGINISGLLYFFGNLSKHVNLRWTKNLYKKFMQDVISLFVNEFGLNIILIPHVRLLTSETDDLAACRKLYASLKKVVQKNVYILEDELTAPQIKYVIGQSDFFIGARMHSCIAALSSFVPTVSISYSHKFEGILKQIELEKLICNPQIQSVEEMLDDIRESYHDRAKIKKKLERTIPEAKERASNCVKFLEVV